MLVVTVHMYSPESIDLTECSVTLLVSLVSDSITGEVVISIDPAVVSRMTP